MERRPPRRILCYGDSNTWGYDPGGGGRLAAGRRWPGVLARALGSRYVVVEEGLNGRTTVHDDPLEEHRNGRSYLPPCLESHAPLDLVVLMLGSNDLKRRFALTPRRIAAGAGELVALVRESAAGPGGSAPQVLLLAPPPLGANGPYAAMFAGGVAKSRRFAAAYARVARERGCAFLDAGAIVAASARDGIHLEAGEHRKLGLAVARRVRDLLPDARQTKTHVPEETGR